MPTKNTEELIFRGEDPALARQWTAGVLLHVTSLPGKHGIGALGAEAYGFVDWLAECEVGLWQILPLSPDGRGNSPYFSWSAFAGNPMLIDLDGLVSAGFLEPQDLGVVPAFPQGRVDYPAVAQYKKPLLREAARRFLLAAKENASLARQFEVFHRQNASWLDDAVLFSLVREAQVNRPWWEWNEALCDRDPEALERLRSERKERIDQEIAIQFFFERQWQALRGYANNRGIRLLGDVAMYVDGDSADVWANQDLFRLGADRRPLAVSGVPPDAFSELGQLWGNPVYDWERIAAADYAWWVQRFRRALSQTDRVRIDHFRGFSAYWEIPADAADARSGQWVLGPGQAFFLALKKAIGSLPLVAEDLGVIDDEVKRLRDKHQLPGMLILQFAFDGDPENPYLPCNHEVNRIVYTGTHDNAPSLGWWRALPEPKRQEVQRILGTLAEDEEIVWELVRAAMQSTAMVAVVPMQDLLVLGDEARMNDPAVISPKNWIWQMDPSWRASVDSERFRKLVWASGRSITRSPI